MSTNALITGGTSGIGREICRKLLSQMEDARLIVTYGHNDAQATDFLEALSEIDRERVILLKADMSSYESMLRMVGKVREQFDHLDYLISNVGITSYAKFDDYTYEEWNRILDTNLSIPVFMIRDLRPLMSENGSILLMGSYAGEQAYSSSLVYGVSKSAVLFLARALVKELEPLGVRVNALAPGFIETPWQKNRSLESYDRINRKIALHRFGNAEEVADMAVSVLRNEYMNGSVVEIHGGYDYF